MKELIIFYLKVFKKFLFIVFILSWFFFIFIFLFIWISIKKIIDFYEYKNKEYKIFSSYTKVKSNK